MDKNTRNIFAFISILGYVYYYAGGFENESLISSFGFVAVVVFGWIWIGFSSKERNVWFWLALVWQTLMTLLLAIGFVYGVILALN